MRISKHETLKQQKYYTLARKFLEMKDEAICSTTRLTFVLKMPILLQYIHEPFKGL